MDDFLERIQTYFILGIENKPNTFASLLILKTLTPSVSMLLFLNQLPTVIYLTVLTNLSYSRHTDSISRILEHILDDLYSKITWKAMITSPTYQIVFMAFPIIVAFLDSLNLGVLFLPLILTFALRIADLIPIYKYITPSELQSEPKKQAPSRPRLKAINPIVDLLSKHDALKDNESKAESTIDINNETSPMNPYIHNTVKFDLPKRVEKQRVDSEQRRKERELRGDKRRFDILIPCSVLILFDVLFFLTTVLPLASLAFVLRREGSLALVTLYFNIVCLYEILLEALHLRFCSFGYSCLGALGSVVLLAFFCTRVIFRGCLGDLSFFYFVLIVLIWIGLLLFSKALRGFISKCCCPIVNKTLSIKDFIFTNPSEVTHLDSILNIILGFTTLNLLQAY